MLPSSTTVSLGEMERFAAAVGLRSGLGGQNQLSAGIKRQVEGFDAAFVGAEPGVTDLMLLILAHQIELFIGLGLFSIPFASCAFPIVS